MVYVHYNLDTLLLEDAKTTRGIAKPFTEGVYYYYNFTNIDLDTDIIFTCLANDADLILYISLSV